MSIKLFEDKLRQDLGPMLHEDNPYDYYDRSARPEIQKMRILLSNWFSNYPDSEKAELKSRFRKTFSSVFYELFLYELFRSQGFEIEIHPKLPDSPKHPDFLIKKGDIEFYVEAKEAKDMSSHEEGQQKKANRFYDALDKAQCGNFLLCLDKVIFKTSNQPATKTLINNVESVCASHDSLLASEQIHEKGWEEGSVKILHEDDDLRIEISLMPTIIRPKSTDRAIGIKRGEIFWGGSEDSIKDSIHKKAKRYGILDKPYIICINATGIRGAADFDIENALWGSLAWSYVQDRNLKHLDGYTRLRDGVFLNEKGPQYKNVSGLFITNVYIESIATDFYSFAKHPYSDYDADFSVFDLSYSFVKDRKIVQESGKTLGEILNIDSGWLYQETI